MATICYNHKLLFIMVPGTGCSSVGKVLREKFGGDYIPKEDIYENNSRILGKKHNKISDLVKFNLMNRLELAIYLKFGTVRNPFDSFATEYQRTISDQWIDKQIRGQGKMLAPNSKKQGLLFLQKLETRLKRRKEQVQNIGFEAWLEGRIGLHSRKSYLLKSLKSFFIYYPNYVPLINSIPSIYSPLLHGVDKVIRFEYLETDFNLLLKEAGIIKRNEWVSIPKTNPTPNKKAYQEYYTKRSRALVEKHFARELATFDYKFE